MRKLIIILSFLALPLMSGAALAASDSGIVRFIDTRTGTLQLSDGATYYVPDRVSLSRFKKGDEVRIRYQRRTGDRVASDVIKMGETQAKVPVITPARGNAGVHKNFVADPNMCKVTATSNPCHVGAQ